jgi:UDP-N-acetylglucosamine/UDP-N-acetylgalactosamine diphosphorylase
MARNPLLLEVDRAEEFSPVKNVSGADSLETSHRDQIARAIHWLDQAGINVGGQESHRAEVELQPSLRGESPIGPRTAIVEISPLFALDADELASKASLIPPIREDAATYLG